MVIQLESLILSLSSSTKLLIIYLLLAAEMLMSFVTIFFYKKDKIAAKRRETRIPEVVLILLPWLMGGLGGFVGIYGLRHKTRHWYFVLNNFLALVVQFALFISIIVLM